MLVDIQSKAFSGKPLLRPIAFEVPAGAFISICGPSGIGKSTLLRIIAGLDEEYSGSIEGRPTLGMVFQEPALMPWLTVVQNVALVSGLEPDASEVTVQLDEVGLTDHIGKYPRALSLGQARRASIARALINKPELLLLDEPFVSLDEETAERMRELLIRLHRDRDCAIVMVTHNPDEAHRLSDRVITLGGSPATISG